MVFLCASARRSSISSLDRLPNVFKTSLELVEDARSFFQDNFFTIQFNQQMLPLFYTHLLAGITTRPFCPTVMLSSCIPIDLVGLDTRHPLTKHLLVDAINSPESRCRGSNRLLSEDAPIGGGDSLFLGVTVKYDQNVVRYCYKQEIEVGVFSRRCHRWWNCWL